MTFVTLEAEERAKQKEIHWIALNGNPSSEKMTTSDNCLAHIHDIVRGETANLGDLFCFFAIRRLLSLVNSATPLISEKNFERA